MKNDRNKLAELAAKLERLMWNSGRERKYPLPVEGFESKVMHRIKLEKQKSAVLPFFQVLGQMAWRWVPAAAGFLILISAYMYYQTSQDDNEWVSMILNYDNSMQWVIQSGDDL